ncbi:MAG: histidine kinase dimerization/phospho-acceptor domain-containing protein [Oscillospiraceae bacterium]
MHILTIISIILCIFLALYIFMLRKEIQKIKKELISNRDMEYSKQITVSLFDKELTDMAAELNRSLDYQKNLKMKAVLAEKSIKQSISNIAHDIRTPLTVIKGNLQLLKNDCSLTENAVRAVDICNVKADELRYLTEDFFELAVLESDMNFSSLCRIDATAAVIQFIADNEAIISGSGLMPRIDFPEKSIFIMADEHMLNRMFGNLLNNIFRYSDGWFNVKITEHDSKCTICFENNIGTENNFDMENIFRRAYQGNKRNYNGGAGLGLYIVKMLAEKQNAQAIAVKKENMLSIQITFETVK